MSRNKRRKRSGPVATLAFEHPGSGPVAPPVGMHAPQRPRTLNDSRGHFNQIIDEARRKLAEIVQWNRSVNSTEQPQDGQLERLKRLRTLTSPQVAEVIVSAGDDSILSSHRREIAAVFCDLRGFTAFSETARPEDVASVLQTYHEAMGKLIHDFKGTIEHRAGDGIMVIFNDPLPCRDPAIQATRMAIAMRDHMGALVAAWRKLGHKLGFGVGLALGQATLGLVGYEGRFDYVANGSVVNLAARLSDEAAHGQILLSECAHEAVRNHFETRCIGELSLKGFRQPEIVFNALALKG